MEENTFRLLLQKYADGAATPEEVAWLESAYINWNRAHAEIHSEEFLKQETDQIWLELNSKTKPPKRSGVYLPLLYAAASLIIIGLFSLLIYRYINPTPDLKNELAKAQIHPGSEKAILILANGERIKLDAIKSGHLADQSSVSISKTKDGIILYSIPENVQETKKIEYNSIVTPAGGEYQVNLPDGSKVWLNASSTLTFPTAFVSERKVKLDGEGYFEVNKISNGAGRIPFVVEAAGQRIEVLGTHFNVNAYKDEPNTKTTLLEGSVNVNNGTLLKPGQQAKGKDGSITILKVEAEDAVDWKNGDFKLENNDFHSILRKIGRWYNVEFIYGNDAPKQLNLGGWISRSKDIYSILKLMEETGKVHFNIEGRRITVSK